MQITNNNNKSQIINILNTHKHTDIGDDNDDGDEVDMDGTPCVCQSVSQWLLMVPHQHTALHVQSFFIHKIFCILSVNVPYDEEETQSISNGGRQSRNKNKTNEIPKK